MHIKYIYIVVQVFVWTVTFLLFSPWPLGMISIEIEAGRVSTAHVQIFFFYEFFVKVIMVFTYAHIALPRAFSAKNTAQTFVAYNLIYLLGFSLFEGVITSLFIRFIDNTPGNTLLEVFQIAISECVINFFLLIYANLSGLTYTWFSDINLRRQIEKEKLAAELAFLKQQIHPHFLFNTLNSLYGLALRNEDESTADGIAKLSNMMRYMIYEARDSLVSLEKEIDYIRNYIDLQRLRVSPNTQIHLNISGSPTGKQIAPMLLIPFVENSFKHGISSSKPAEIDFTLDIQENILIFKSSNPIVPKSQPELDTRQKGIGLSNVAQRLQLLYPNSYRFKTETIENMYHTELILSI